MDTASPQSIFFSAVLVIALGYVLRRRGLVDRRDGSTIARIVINVTLPAVILQTVPGIDFRASLLFLPLLALAHGAVSFAIVTLIFRRSSPARRGLFAICAMGFNNGLFAFPIDYEIWGGGAIQLLAVFDVGNGFVVLGVNYVVASWFGALAVRASGRTAADMTLREALRAIGYTICTSVPIIAFAVAVALNLLGLELPGAVRRTIDIVASANGALALLVLGIFQSLNIRRRDWTAIFKVLGLRYAIGALFAVVSVALLGTGELFRNILSIVFILPIGMTVIPYSVEFNLDSRLATTMVNVSIVVSFLLMWVIVAVGA